MCDATLSRLCTKRPEQYMAEVRLQLIPPLPLTVHACTYVRLYGPAGEYVKDPQGGVALPAVHVQEDAGSSFNVSGEVIM